MRSFYVICQYIQEEYFGNEPTFDLTRIFNAVDVNVELLLKVMAYRSFFLRVGLFKLQI